MTAPAPESPAAATGFQDVVVVYGTRPEAVKQAPVVTELRRRAVAGAALRVRVLSTGQHREMLRPLVAHFNIAPDVDLDIMTPGQTLAEITSRAVAALDRSLRDLFADTPNPAAPLVLVQGDTTTAMCAALASFYNNFRVGHVEAGLRTGNLRSPFPEELNRLVITRIAALNFAPTAGSRDNLLREGLRPEQRVVVTGNTVIDALLYTVDRVRAAAPDHEVVRRVRAWDPEGKRRLVLITGHRRENFGAPFAEFCRAIGDLARAHEDVVFLYPVHLNPNVQKPVRAMLSDTPNVWLTAPADYAPFVWLLDRCTFAITDSGGVQEEAPALGKPVLVTRDTTERPEAVDAGAARLIGPSYDAIVREGRALLGSTGVAGWKLSQGRSPYGDGRAAARIADAILGCSVSEFESA